MTEEERQKEMLEAVKELLRLMNEPYKPHPIEIEGGEAYKKKIHVSTCPYTDPERKKLWEHGWNVTDIGYMKAVPYSGEPYEDPKNWI